MPDAARQQQIQNLLLSLATALIDPDMARLDAILQEALADMAQLVRADRAYLLSYDFNHQTGTNTHEWCAPGIEPHIHRFQVAPLGDYAEWVTLNQRGQSVCVDDVAAMAPGGLKDLLQGMHLKSVLALPLLDGTNCLGCVGFDATRKAAPYLQEHIQLLTLFARLLVNVRRKQRSDHTLQSQRDTLQLILDHAPIGIWLQNHQGKVAFVNRAFCQSIGVSEDRFKAVSHYTELLPAGFRDQCSNSDALAVASEGTSETHEQLPFVDGRLHDLRVIKAVKRDAQNRVEFLVGLSVDVTDDLAKQRALRESEERLRLALAAARQAWFDVEVATGLVTLSPEYHELIGHDLTVQASDMTTWKAHVHPDDRELAMAVFQQIVKEGGPLSVDYRRKTANGGWKWLRSVGKVSERDALGKPLRVVGIHTDIQLLKAHEIQLEHMAHFDALTGLPNRALLADRLQQAMAQALRHGRRLAVVYLDLDGFKSINDAHGHDTGDQLLKAVSLRLCAALREGDTMARLGGDEFVAVLLDVQDVGACRPILERLLAAARQPLTLGELPVAISASLGMTFYPQADEVNGDQLLRQADQAMYQAKVLGKNRFAVFDAVQAREAQGRQQTLDRLRQALTDHEFVLHFQPQVNMRTGKVVGAEALIRWQHPTLGLLAPGKFLPDLSGHPLAIEMGNWVLNAALNTQREWRAAGLALPVSVNVDAQQLQDPDFVPTLKALLRQHPELNPGDLELEVVESSALEDVTQASQTMTDCAELGVGFALDDFGTGYASLTYLRRLPAGLLKIDQSFVRDMLDDPDDMALMAGVIGLANAFRRRVIAEGVETAQQAQALLTMGCDWGQGYGIARPMPGALLPAWAAQWKPPPEWKTNPP
jgi:diguanylate cyclase (GGDEF)-like protein/PAS domain S-box-containing protein